MPYITPLATPDITVRRCLLIPDDERWLAAFNGAISELLMPYNWEQVDGITPIQAAEKAAEIFYQYLEGCSMIGEIKAFASLDALPENCLPMDGHLRDEADYQELYAVLPAAWKGGGEFTLPNMHYHTLIGNNPDAPSGTPVAGSEGGEQFHTLTEAEMPSHRHGAGSGTGFIVAVPSDGSRAHVAGGTMTVSTNTGFTGGGGQHNNMPPFLSVIWAIVAR